MLLGNRNAGTATRRGTERVRVAVGRCSARGLFFTDIGKTPRRPRVRVSVPRPVEAIPRVGIAAAGGMLVACSPGGLILPGDRCTPYGGSLVLPVSKLRTLETLEPHALRVAIAVVATAAMRHPRVPPTVIATHGLAPGAVVANMEMG